MKSKLIRTGLVALALTLAAPSAMVQAQEINSLYIAPKISYSYQKGEASSLGKDDDKGFGLGVAVGTDLGYYYEVPLRFELEYMYRTEADYIYGGGNSFNHYTVAAHSMMANAFFDITTQTSFTPYLGAGLGLAYLDTDYNNSAGTTWNLAWSLMAGVGYSLSESMTLDLGYRYIDLGQGDSGAYNSPAVDYTAHELGVGLRFSGF